MAGWTPNSTADSEAVLLGIEERIGRKLPMKFRLLYALENGPAIIAKFSNDDFVIELNDLGRPLRGYTQGDPLTQDLLPFMIENQQVCVWAINLNHEDDPPVFVNYDDGTVGDWKLCSEHFTSWFYCLVWDSLLVNSCVGNAIGPALEADQLRRIRGRFSEGHKTFIWPGKVNYRFANALCRLLLWDSEGQCDWWVALNSDNDARAELEEIRRIAGDAAHFS